MGFLATAIAACSFLSTLVVCCTLGVKCKDLSENGTVYESLSQLQVEGEHPQ